MYARQYHQIGLDGLLDTINLNNLTNVAQAGLLTYVQLRQQKEAQKVAEQNVKIAKAQADAERAKAEQTYFQSIIEKAQTPAISMPILLGIGALVLFFFMRKR